MTKEFDRQLAEHRREAHRLGHAREYLRQIVFGGNDGIVTTFAIVAGFAGAGAEGAAHFGGAAVLLFGIANLLADATSMGLGEFLSSRSARDVYRSTRRAELRALRDTPNDERAEVLAILANRGVAAADANAMADVLMRNPDLMADFMMTYEMELPDPGSSTGWTNGLATFLSFLAFGAIPISPYVALPATQTTAWLSAGATFAALVLLGVLRWRVTGDRPARAIGETVIVGTICAAVAFLVGTAFR